MQESIRKEQELILDDYFCMMIRLFPDIIIQWNYSEVRGVILVNYIVNEDADWYENFCELALAFETEMHNRYHDLAPLFEDNNKVFNINKCCETYYVVDRGIIDM